MQIFRNKEIKQFALWLICLSILFVSIGFTISIVTGFLVLITIFFLCLSFALFTWFRYRNLKHLAEYLRQILSGNYSLDIQDHEEGELSILKSEINKVTLMLTEYNEQLKQEKLLLSKQMSEISHQLKTPLTSMMVMVDLLERNDLPAGKRQEFASLINNQLKRIEWLVTALLKMAKLDAGVVKMKSDQVSAAKLIDTALQPFLITMELKDITYDVNAGDYQVRCDYEWTMEAIINIIKNSIEHTPTGGHIDILVQDNLLYSEISISDNGSGINKEDLPHIFTRFYRGRNASPDSVGIGLAMSYEIIRNQLGDILVKSEPGKGSTFMIKLYKSIL